MTPLVAQLLDAQGVMLAQFFTDSDQFIATMLPCDFERAVTCRLLDLAGDLQAEVSIQRGEH